MAEYSPLRALFALAPKLRGATGETLTLYMPAPAPGYDPRYYDIVFGDLLHRYRERLGAKELEILEREIPRLRSHIAIPTAAGCAALAGFAESARGLLEVIKLPLTTPERLEVGEPLLGPALRQIEALPSTLVAVVDKEHARTFGVILEHVFPIADVIGSEVRHSKAGGTSALSNQRKAENRARSNLAAVVEEVTRELKSGAYGHLLTAGPQEARAQFEALLPPWVAAMISGHVVASLDSATLEDDVRRHVLAPAAVA